MQFLTFFHKNKFSLQRALGICGTSNIYFFYVIRISVKNHVIENRSDCQMDTIQFKSLCWNFCLTWRQTSNSHKSYWYTKMPEDTNWTQHMSHFTLQIQNSWLTWLKSPSGDRWGVPRCNAWTIRLPIQPKCKHVAVKNQINHPVNQLINVQCMAGCNCITFRDTSAGWAVMNHGIQV